MRPRGHAFAAGGYAATGMETVARPAPGVSTKKRSID